MPNLLINPGFELATGWTVLGEGQYSDIQAHAGIQSASLFTLYSSFGPLSQFSEFKQTVATVAGFTYPFRFWLFGGGSANRSFRAWVDGVSKLLISGGNLTEWTFEDFSFVASGPTAEVKFEAFVGAPVNGSATWYVDDAAVGEEAALARIGSELPVRALMSTLYANVNAELTGIASERGDSKPLPAVESWYTFPRGKISPDHCEIEIYETNITKPMTRLDLSRSLGAGTRTPWELEVEVLVALNFANREEASAGDLFNRGRRYMDAIMRVIHDNPTLGQPTLVARMDRPRIMQRPLEDTTRVAVRVECPVSISVQESSSGEMTASGGVPPASVLEQV